MHRKEQVIAPILEEALGLQVEVSPGLDTDRFGTFTREVPRPGTQLATVRLKAQAALAAVPEAAFGLASEGSFGPHPWFPLVGCTGCSFREERVPATGQALASPAECDLCNP